MQLPPDTVHTGLFLRVALSFTFFAALMGFTLQPAAA
jgi:hypothetical protein